MCSVVSLDRNDLKLVCALNDEKEKLFEEPSCYQRFAINWATKCNICHPRKASEWEREKQRHERWRAFYFRFLRCFFERRGSNIFWRSTIWSLPVRCLLKNVIPFSTLFTSLTIYGDCLCCCIFCYIFVSRFLQLVFALYFWQLPKKRSSGGIVAAQRYFCEWTAAARHQPLNEMRQKIFMHENVAEKRAEFWESFTDLQMSSQQQKNKHFLAFRA